MIRLVPMDEAEFQASLERGIRRHAEDGVGRGSWSEQVALEASWDEFAQLLPQGRETSNRHFVLVIDAEHDRKVGEAWYLCKQEVGRVNFWVDWLWIEPEARRKGYATSVLRLLEIEASAAGADRIGLGVVADNAAAMALYSKLGFRPARLHLEKHLPKAQLEGAR